MADTTYYVRVKYVLDGGAQSAVNGLASSFDKLGAAVAGAFAAHKVLDFSKRLIDLQSQAETMQIALATMLTGFGAPGFAGGAKDFEKAMSASSELMKQIRKDAAVLPGTAEELMEVTRAAMPSGIDTGHAVLGKDSILKMSERLLASADLLKIPGGATTVSREFAALMEGRAQGRNDLFARLRGLMPGAGGGPVSAKEFNKLTAEGRWDLVDAALKKLVDPALPSYAKTWKAMADTTTNWAQQIARVATGSMFKNLEAQVMSLNGWFEKNQQSIEAFASSIGDSLGNGLGDAFGGMKTAVEFLVNNKETVLSIAQALGAAMLAAKAGSGGPMQGALAGYGVNLLTGGSNDLQGVMMGVAGSLISFGGALGVASAAALAFGAAMNMLDPEKKKGNAALVEKASIYNAVPEGAYDEEAAFMNAPGGIDLPGMPNKTKKGPIDYGVLKSIIREQNLMTSPGGPLNEAALENYLGPVIKNPLYKQHVKDAFDVAAASMSADWRKNTHFGPEEGTAEQKLSALLYDKNKPANSRKADVNVTVNIQQDISQAEDPDRLLVRTKQAIEDALVRPIETGHNRFSVLR